MKEKIQELIFHHKNSKNEVSTLLEELNQIGTDKISYQEDISLKELKAKYQEEYDMRQLFIQDLESLL